MRLFSRGAHSYDSVLIGLFYLPCNLMLFLLHCLPKMTTTLPFALVKRFIAVSEPRMRRGLIASTLREADASTVSIYLEHLILGIEDADLRALYQDTIRAILGASCLPRDLRREVYTRLWPSPLGPVFLFLAEAKDGPVPSISPENPYDYEEVASGVRKSMARRQDPEVLTRLCFDPDPKVVEVLLANPRVTEEHAIKVASLRPQTKENFWVVFESRFGVRERVQAALASNPFCPVRLAVALLPLISATHQAEICNSPALDPRVREAARALLERRAA